MGSEEDPTFLVSLKYYTTLTLGLVSCLSCFSFMFMVPFFLEPSISTLVANFDPEPVTCKTVYSEHLRGMINCSWSSCKHGCTVDQFDCDRIYVDYMLLPFKDYIEGEDFEDKWVIQGVPIFVNIKACGYPPKVNCTEFSNNYVTIGNYFGCHYSRTNPSLVITDYSWSETVYSLIMALIIPNVLTGVSLGVLSYWWYPGCQKRRCQYQLPPDQEAGTSHGEHEDDEEEDEEHECVETDEDEEEKIRETKEGEKDIEREESLVKMPLKE